MLRNVSPASRAYQKLARLFADEEKKDGAIY